MSKKSSMGGKRPAGMIKELLEKLRRKKSTGKKDWPCGRNTGTFPECVGMQ